MLGTAPLPGDGAQDPFSETNLGPPRRLRIRDRSFARRAWSARFHPRSRSDLIGEQFAHRPDMIRQPTGHGRGAGMSDMLGFGEFVMGPTEIVGAANQVHAAVQPLQARSRVPTLARETGQSLAKGSIQALDKRRIEHASSTRKLEQLLCLLQQTASHLACDLDHSLFLRALDHGSNMQFWPKAQAGSAHPNSFFDLVAKGAPNAAWIG